MKPLLILLTLALGFSLCASTARADDARKAPTVVKGTAAARVDDSGQIKLPPRLLKALTKEMRSIDKNMKGLVTSIATGDWKKTKELATAIKESFILKQSLGKKDIEELHEKLPEGFKRMDHYFHNMAGRLAHVAERKDPVGVTFFFNKMNETCLRCHARYAPEKFPGLKRERRSRPAGPAETKLRSEPNDEAEKKSDDTDDHGSH